MKTQKLKVLLLGAIVLLFAGTFSSCSKKKDSTPPVDKTALAAEIVTATNLKASTHEGVAAGDVLKGSQATLQAAIDAATTVAADATATQAAVTAAAASLADAVTAYNANIVVAIDPTNLVGQWTFDEVASATVGTTVKDYSGNSHDGTIKVGHVFWGAGTPTLAADRYGNANKALHFDQGGNVEIPFAASLNPTVMSVSVWAKPDVQTPTPQNNQYFLSMNRWNGYKFNFQDTPRAFFTVTYDDPTATPPVLAKCCYNEDQNAGTSPQGEWHNYIVTFGGGHMVFYIDGVVTKDWDNHPGTVTQLSTGVNLVFGQDLPTSVYVTTPDSDPNYVNYGGYYIGILDEVRIYKSVLTQSQVTSIYNLEKP